MVAVARPRATYDDLVRVPEPLVAEIVDGVLYTHPRPAFPHARVSSVLGSNIGTPFDWGGSGPGGWVIYDEPELHFGDDVVVPDIAGWRRERMPELPVTAFTRLAPDWVCEVLSPSTQALDRSGKMDVYAREGVRHLWFVDPIERTLEVYRLERGLWVRVATYRDDAVVRAEPFDAIELELAALWDFPPEPDESHD
ncbi:MAG: Uma2 family endonuclease [Polyangiaceae bacterium]|nr:Uma2 family endonuclease [Polyangiaceae bacterium]